MVGVKVRWPLLVATFVGSQVNADVDATALGDRIAAAETSNWPEVVFEVTLEGCSLTYLETEFSPARRTFSLSVWLNDIVLEPSISASLRTEKSNAGLQLPRSVVRFRFVEEILEASRKDIARYTAAKEMLLEDTQLPRLGLRRLFWDQDQAETQRIEATEALHKALLAGRYGPFLQRNHAKAFGLDMSRSRYFHSFEVAASGISFTLPDHLLDGILADFHQYRLENCPPPD